MLFLLTRLIEVTCRKYIYYRLMEYRVIMDWEQRTWYKSWFLLLLLSSMVVLIVSIWPATPSTFWTMATELFVTVTFFRTLCTVDTTLITLNVFLRPRDDKSKEYLSQAKFVAETRVRHHIYTVRLQRQQIDKTVKDVTEKKRDEA